MRTLGSRFLIELSPLFRTEELIDGVPHLTVMFYDNDSNLTEIGKLPSAIFYALPTRRETPASPPAPPRPYRGVERMHIPAHNVIQLTPEELKNRSYDALYRGKDGHVISRKVFEAVTDAQAGDLARAHAISLGEKVEDWSVTLKS